MKVFALTTAYAVIAVATIVTGTLVSAQAVAHDSAPTTITAVHEALVAAKDAATPVGVIFTGTVETLNELEPSTNTANAEGLDADANANNDHHIEAHEDFGHCHGHHGFSHGRRGHYGGYGGYGGWGRFGPHRFGYRCGGVDGWAYPLGYWNSVGAGLYGGGCGLGLAAGGLFYC